MLWPTICAAWLALVASAVAGSQPEASAADSAAGRSVSEAFAGQDLYLRGRDVITHQLPTGSHILVFQSGFDMIIGAHQYHSDTAVVWLEPVTTKFGETMHLEYHSLIYLSGNVTAEAGPGALTTELQQRVLQSDHELVLWFDVAGEVFVTADQRRLVDPTHLFLYRQALIAFQTAGVLPEGVEIPDAESCLPQEPSGKPTEPSKPTKGPVFRYPINIAPAGEQALQLELARSEDGTGVVTVTGRFYLWQKQDEKGSILELQADSAVLYFSQQALKRQAGQPTAEQLLAEGAVKGIYLCGDVVMSQGLRAIRADEIYYDFEHQRAIALNAVMRSFDPTHNVPIYVKAEKLRQLAANKFSADNIVLTTSEFYRPQISVEASKVVLTDTTDADQRQGTASKGSFEAEMHDVRFKVYDRTIFHWPYVRTNLQQPDVPLKSVHTGYDSDWGPMLETRWYLARLLGLKEPEGTESTLAVDYYGKRGLGAGVEIDYKRENYFGSIIGYVIDDHGKDDLGRHYSRERLEPERELRGRFTWRHRYFLPDNWQLTGELSYISDEHFLEGFYRSEFYVGKDQETTLHLKRIEANRGFSLLGKVRINDFVDELEELPTAEYHWTGQSFFNDRLTFYSDSQVSRFRQRYASSVNRRSEQFYSFATTRNEIDMPLQLGRTKVVPFVAATVAYEDGLGFTRELDGGTGNGEDGVWFAETGARLSPQPYWKVYPNVKSRLWDLNQLRHIVQPYLVAVAYSPSDSVIDQRDVLNIGLSQRLQTKRGIGSRRRTVDWMRLNMDITWVNDSGDASAGPDKFFWNRPFIPLVNPYSSLVPPLDRRSSVLFGTRRNSFNADYLWRISDTTALLSDMNFDIQSGVVQQFNIGFSRLRWPNLSYYIGTRYLRRVEIVDPTGVSLQKGSNAFVLAVTYVLDPRYTVVFSQQFDFDYGSTVRSDITLIRRYHRIYWGFTFSADESLDKKAVVFSIWPQGAPDLAIGPRRYMQLGGTAGY